MDAADSYMWDVAEYLGEPRLTHRSEFQEFCGSAFGSLTVEQAAEEWERR